MKLLLVCLVLCLAVSSQAALSLLDNLHAGGNGDSNPAGYAFANGVYFFAATSKTTGRELYSFNSSTPGASLVHDTNPGLGDGIPYGQGYIAAIGSGGANVQNPFVVFAGYNSTLGSELWLSDGTDAGTKLAADIYPGNRSSDPAQFVAVGTNVYFVATSDRVGREIFRYSKGSLPLAIDIFKGSTTLKTAAPSSYPDALTYVANANGTPKGIYFTAYTDKNGRELYFISAGGGTATLIDVNKGAGGSFPTQLTALNGKLFFQATTPATGTDLFVVSSSAAVSVDANPGAGSSWASYFTASPFTGESNLAYFSAYTPKTGFEVFVTDGTATKGHTSVFLDINQGPEDSNPSFLTGSASNQLVYLQYTDSTGAFQLGYFDNTLPASVGTIGSSVQAFQPVTGSAAGISNNQFYNANGTLFFYSYTAAAGRELTYISPSATKSVSIININPKIGSSLLQTDNFAPVADINTVGQFFFTASTFQRGYEAYIVKVGSGVTVNLIDDVNTGADGSSNAGRSGFYRLGGRTGFSAFSGLKGLEPYATGFNVKTSSFVVKNLANVAAAQDSSYPSKIISFARGYVFSAFSLATGRELVKVVRSSNKVGFVIAGIAEVVTGPVSGNPTSITAFGTDLYFAAYTPATGVELFYLPGTSAFASANIALISDIFPGNGSSYPSNLVSFNNYLYFSACGNNTGCELWRTDGSIDGSGVTLVADINKGAGSSNPANFAATNTAALGPLLYFTADDGLTGIELWVTDTVVVKQVADINSGPGDSTPSQFLFYRNILFFVARDIIVGEEVRAAAPQSEFFLTGAISDIAKGVADSEIQSLTRFRRNLYFGATEPVNGSEVYYSRGTSASTKLFADVSKGERSSSPRNFVIAHNKLYFTADDIASGREVFVANQAAASPRFNLYADLNGPASSYPTIAFQGKSLLVSAYEANTGFELYSDHLTIP